MSINTYEHARNRTRNRIVDATVDLIREIGYDKLNISRIADRADIGRGTFYRYFESVDAVLLHIFREISQGLYAEIEEILNQYESPEREKRAWIAAFQHLETFKPLFKHLQGNQSNALWADIARHNLAGFFYSLNQNNIMYREWMDLPVDVMAHFTSGAVLSLTRAWFAGEINYSATELGEMVFKLLYHRA